MGGLGVPLVLGNSLSAIPMPNNFSRGFVDAVQSPDVNPVFLHRGDLVINTDLQAIAFLITYRSGDKDSIPPQDWAGMPQTGDADLPLHVL